MTDAVAAAAAAAEIKDKKLSVMFVHAHKCDMIEILQTPRVAHQILNEYWDHEPEYHLFREWRGDAYRTEHNSATLRALAKFVSMDLVVQLLRPLPLSAAVDKRPGTSAPSAVNLAAAYECVFAGADIKTTAADDKTFLILVKTDDWIDYLAKLGKIKQLLLVRERAVLTDDKKAELTVARDGALFCDVHDNTGWSGIKVSVWPLPLIKDHIVERYANVVMVEGKGKAS
jgi:hypothetical protein